MEQNKTRSYLLYAVGEIALVMIGILLALQVNNWNEDRSKKAQENIILEEILSDLTESETNLSMRVQGDSVNVKNDIQSMKIVWQHMKEGLPYNDSLAIHYSDIFTYRNIVYKISGYETLKSYGYDYILDPQIRKQIGLYYTTVVPQTRFQFEEVRDDFYAYMIDYLRLDFVTVFPGESHERRSLYLPVDYPALSKNTEFLQSINVYRDIQELYVENLERSLEETIELKQLITKYMDN